MMQFRSQIRPMILLSLLGFFLIINPTVAAGYDQNPVLQAAGFQTPTPGPDGRIVYIVKEGDDFWTIAALAGMSLEELFALNGIQPNDFAIPGTELLLGYSGPAEPTLDTESIATPTPVEPTPTPLFSTGEICVLLFNDSNGNARLEETEQALAGGQISIVDVDGVVAVDATTEDIPEGQCFSDLDAGDYNVSAAVPEAYNATTSMSLPIRLLAGDVKYVQFGAQPSAAVLDDLPEDGGERSVWFGILGILLLVAAGGLGFYASRYGRRTRVGK